MLRKLKGCGADIRECEGNNLFHDFDLNDGTPTADQDYGDDNQMSLSMPSRVTDRIDCMADRCLGRRRLPEYVDSDPLLEPCPSVVSREMHGKTLPIV